LLSTAIALPVEPITPAPTSPLEIVKSVDPASDTGYILSYKNAGAITLFNVTITDELPADSTFVSASPSGVYQTDTHTVVWPIGTLAGGSEGTVSVETSFDFGALTDCVEITNTATIRGVGPASTPEDDGVVTDTDSTLQEFCPKNPDLQVDKKVANGGENYASVTFVINYANMGNWPAYDVTVSDILPVGVDALTAVPEPDSFDNGVARWFIHRLDVGENGSIEVTLPTTNGDALPCGQLTNSAEIIQDLDAPRESSATVYPERNFLDNASAATTDYVYGTCQGEINGNKWSDLDKNGAWDDGEPGLPNWTVELLTDCSQNFADYDYYDNGVIDLSDFVAWTQGYQVFDPKVDLNHDGIISRLDLECFAIPFRSGGTLSGSPTVIKTTTTDANGAYSFPGLYGGAYSVREVMQDGWTQTAPGNELGMIGPFVLAFGGTVANQNFGNHFSDGSIGGEPIVTPKLALEKSVNASIQSAGSTLTYLLTVTVSDATAQDVAVTDPIPAHLTFVKASNGGTYDASSKTVTWSLGDLVPGTYPISLTVKIDGVVSNNTVVTNTATARAASLDPVTASADVSLTSTPGLTIEKTVDDARTNPGKTLTYTVRVSNTGSDEATNVVLTDTLPDGLVFADTSKTNFTKSLGTLSAGETITTNYDVNVGAEVEAGNYDNVATVHADNLDPKTSTARVAVIVGSVLGAEDTNDGTPSNPPGGQVLGAEDTLPETGAGATDVALLLIGLGILAAGVAVLRRRTPVLQ
jgi:uncharacterized repeat protein (TIGR01451 family)/LPXTG-motif cell wall-anchored protein